MTKFNPSTLALMTLLFVGSLFNACSESSTKQEESTSDLTPKAGQTDQESVTYKLGTYQEAKAFMNAQVEIPISDDYVTPEYIISATDQGEAFAEFGNRYPEFYGKEKTDLLDAVMEYPERYIEMINENKALRRQFDPNSRY